MMDADEWIKVRKVGQTRTSRDPSSDSNGQRDPSRTQ
jgi:hypothetical protein